jgi:hypothetical protein
MYPIHFGGRVVAKTKETDEQAIWRVFMNAPGPQAVHFYETATKILTSRNIIKPPRKRKTDSKTKES